MKAGLALTIVAALGLCGTMAAQNSNATASDGARMQQSGPGDGQRGDRGSWGGGMGRGVTGTVTELAADHYAIKTETGETYTIHYSANTRILKQQPRQQQTGAAREAGGRGNARGAGPGSGESQRPGGDGGFGGGGANPPTAIKPTDIKVGDAVIAMGEVDAKARSIGAIAVIQIDPERAKEMRAMQANYGKTWLMGKVTAIDGVKVTLMGNLDQTAHAFVADENTTFRKRRDPITLGDIQVGDVVRVEGTIRDGAFLATAVNAMGAPPEGGPGGHPNGPPAEPLGASPQQ